MRGEIIIGIYSITNSVNGKTYIGQGTHLRQRWIHHRDRLRKHTHHNAHLQNAWNKYGEEAFRFSIIERCERSQLNEREQAYISSTSSDLLYNFDLVVAPVKRMSQETKDKIAASHRGIRPNAETRALLSVVNKQRFEDEAYRERHRENMRALMSRPERRRVQSEQSRSFFAIPENREAASKAKDHKKKPVEALIDGVVQYRFSSLRDCARIGADHSAVARACTGKAKTHLGLEWRWAE